jgi:hypothetical protein
MKLRAAVIVDMVRQGFAGCCRVVTGFLGTTKEDIIAVLGAYADVLIKGGYGGRIFLRRLFVRRRQQCSFGARFHGVD